MYIMCVCMCSFSFIASNLINSSWPSHQMRNFVGGGGGGRGDEGTSLIIVINCQLHLFTPATK